MSRNYHTLDAIVVCAALVLLALGGATLAFVKIPGDALPILASLITGVLGILTAYVGARWGNKKPSGNGEGDEAGTMIQTPRGPSTVAVDTPAPDKP